MQLPDHSDYITALLKEGCLAGMQGKVLAAFHGIFLHANRPEEALHNALHVVEIDQIIARIPRDRAAASGNETRDLEFFVNKFRDRQCLREKYRRNIK